MHGKNKKKILSAAKWSTRNYRIAGEKAAKLGDVEAIEELSRVHRRTGQLGIQLSN